MGDEFIKITDEDLDNQPVAGCLDDLIPDEDKFEFSDVPDLRKRKRSNNQLD